MSDGHIAEHVAELRLPLETAGAELVRAFVREASLAESVPATVASRIAADAEEAWRALCRNGDNPGRADILVSCGHGDVRARLLLSGHSRFSAIVASLGDRVEKDAGLSFRERGVDGWEITLHRKIDFSREAVAPVEETNAPAPAATGDVEIDRPQESDSPAIARCFLAVYGHNYLHREVFSPRRYWRKVTSGETIPVVTRDGQGEVIGHVALEREAGAVIAERGEAVVLPAYRGRRLLERMTERLTQEAVRLGLVGIYAQPVTTHTFSQRNDERAGMPVCAILLGAAPETSHSKDLPVSTAGQRQSFLLTFRFLGSAPTRVVAAPAAYRDMLSEIYRRLGVAASMREGETPAFARSSTALMVNDRGFGKIRFETIGSDVDIELAQSTRDVESLGARTAQLSAPVDDPGLPLLVESARRLGFFFCGIGPAFSEGRDIFLMQRLSEPLDVSLLQLFSQAAKELAAFTERDRQFVAGLG